ncbi:MAG TPA: sulfatase, partial [Thermodesulfobacteriota bacterium]|nr:sulfatase [Thermodesulfobacteriota bacterium]
MALVVLSPFVIWAVSRGYGVLSGAFKETDRQVRHVILLTVDTLRVDVLSCYDNQQSVPTPHIDQLAKDGVLFTKAISAAPWTLPSFSSIMTGLSPSVHMTTKSSSRLPDNLKTLAEYMRDSGYYTAAIGYNWFLRPDHNVSQGFLGYNFFPKSSLGKSFGVRLIKWSFPDKFRSEASTRDLTRLAINWLQSNYKKDFFLWIHYFDPHEPYVPPPRFLPKRKPPPGMGKEFDMKTKELRDGSYTPPLDERVWIKKLYEGEVRYVDENIGKLFSTLKSLNLYDESLIIFTSDHGEEFWDHGGYEHGHTLYNELIQVPLIVKLPMSAKKGEVSTFVSTQSIMPTILNLTGIGYDGDYLSGNSLSPLWGSNPDGFNRKPLISTGLLYFEDRESVIFDGLKYIRFLKTNREELYDLVRDPKEKTSIVNSSPESVERARGILREQKKIARELGEHYPRADIEEKVKFDKEAKQKLKAVGYLQ